MDKSNSRSVEYLIDDLRHKARDKSGYWDSEERDLLNDAADTLEGYARRLAK